MDKSDPEVRGIDLLGLNRKALAAVMEELGQPSYRAGQLMDWIYRRGVTEFADMTDLPLDLRARMAEVGYEIRPPRITEQRTAGDGTIKFLFTMTDGEQVEGVYMPEKTRRTICLSTQVGCGMACAFCATGRAGLVRNLSAGEILGQLMAVQKHTGKRITNVVAMGQGEPLANYQATVDAFRLCGRDGIGIAARHLAISTCGLPAGIRRLAAEGHQWQLAVSLHAAVDVKRDRLMPINRRFPLAQLRSACAEYAASTGRRITLEYVLIKDFNDGRDDAKAVAEFCRGFSVHVNLLPWNAVPGMDFAPTSPARVMDFAVWLRATGINTTIRRSRGGDCLAACGQLRAGQVEDKQ